MGNLNVMLIVFVLLGYAVFTGIFESETAKSDITTKQGYTSPGSIINSLFGLMQTPSVNLTNVQHCSGFTDCTEALAKALIDLVTSVIFILLDIVILFTILIVVFVMPLPSAPIYIQILIWVIEIGGLYVLIGLFRGGE